MLLRFYIHTYFQNIFIRNQKDYSLQDVTKLSGSSSKRSSAPRAKEVLCNPLETSRFHIPPCHGRIQDISHPEGFGFLRKLTSASTLTSEVIAFQ